MNRFVVLASLLAASIAPAAVAQEGAVPHGVPHLDHVFVIMMENHGYNQVVGNPDDPFVNQYIKSASFATNYFAVGHPSLTNYLEVVGGSNFGVRTDNSPDWHNATCATNLSNGFVSTDTPATGNICPISGTGTDAATPAIDYTNETTGPPGDIDVDGIMSYPANPQTVGKTIADQLVSAGMTWKSYQEDLPPTGADKVNLADGFFTNNTVLSTALPGETTSLVGLYAVKHNPFAYFSNIQSGDDPDSSLKNMASFTGRGGLFADLEFGTRTDLFVHCAEPMPRPARTRQCGSGLRVRSERQRNPGGTEFGADVRRRRGAGADCHGDPSLARPGTTAEARS